MRPAISLRHPPPISRNAPLFSLPPLSLLPPSPSLSQILQSHAHLVSLGLSSSRSAMSHLLAACAVSPSPPPSYFHSIYLQIQLPNVFASNNLLRCLSKGENPNQALAFYKNMRISGVPTNKFTFPVLLHACTRDPSLPQGTQVHAHAFKFGFCEDLYVRNALISLYSACRSFGKSRQVFDELPECRDLVSWNAMLAGHVRNGQIDVAENMFDEMPERDVITWSTMIMGYVQNGVLEKGLDLFGQMVRSGRVFVNEATLVTVLSASAQLGLLEHGTFIHSIIKNVNFPLTMALGTALVDMYAKCGCIDLAQNVFYHMPKRDVFAWNAMICGIASHGQGKEALELFQQFINEGLNPTAVTFVGILNACSRAGLVDEGRRFFNSMANEYGIEPEMEHYGCMVDLFGRAGLIPEALELIQGMSVKPDCVLWATLLGACKMHGFVELGIIIGKNLIKLEPGHDGHYVLLAALYAKARKWEDVTEVRRLMSSRGTSKVAGWSLIEANGELHKFIAGDLDHKESSKIYKMIEIIGKKLAEAGYLPDVSSVLHDIEDEEKIYVINVHSERLAIAYGLMVVEQGRPIRIVKNLRVCVDCHEFSKMVSKVLGREIIVRDGSRFHHFKDGFCSCVDYW
ncbi:pentatricopeptide repeat-containing protein At5g66520-like [Phalaenopsis equestris]|uniref:pentatricopeptide repeat-containing protein At5g66520-like n=1 Tax=Phalaenopsis equestris TaxID=78828 RepID=UPI0009E29104|nr:pentatricopeptide repeat-containing protein At5g66520-like [Phalaenopsis equestris]